MKVLVCGSSGLVGRDLCSLLDESSIEYVGIHNTRSVKNSHRIDILNEEELRRFFDKHLPTVCVNCIADRNVDACEKNWEQTKRINIDIVEALVKLCAELDIPFFHISTDYVFDGRGTSSSLTEPNPLQNYGISKLIAEKRILAYDMSSCIIRVPVLYTDSYHSLSETAVTQLAKKVFDSTKVVKEDNYSIRRPVFIPDLCTFILDCIMNEETGVFHFNNPIDRTSKYMMCKAIGDFLQIPTNHIIPNNSVPTNNAGRPYDTDLFDIQYERSDYPITTIDQGIKKIFSKFLHPRLILTEAPSESVFYLIDLDGTLLDTDKLHFNCYKAVLDLYSINLEWSIYEKVQNLNLYLQTLIKLEFSKERWSTMPTLEEVKEKKNKLMMQSTSIQFIKGAEELLHYFDRYSINYAVVTNTSLETVTHFKTLLPSLNLVKNWVTRQDYTEPKPSPECYKLAIKKFYNNEEYIVGIENTVAGYTALKSSTSHIYMVGEADTYTHKTLANEDIYFVKDIKSMFLDKDHNNN